MKREEDFDNWIIMSGIVTSPPIKSKTKNAIYYNFTIDNSKFKLCCTITMFEENKILEEKIFGTIIEDKLCKVSGKLFMNKKRDKLWVQLNVRNWIEYGEGNIRVQHKITDILEFGNENEEYEDFQ